MYECHEITKTSNREIVNNRYICNRLYVCHEKTKKSNRETVNNRYICNRLYINYVSTGPKPKTIADFWTLVSQEEVTVIVCLTNLKEGAKVLILLR